MLKTIIELMAIGYVAGGIVAIAIFGTVFLRRQRRDDDRPPR